MTGPVLRDNARGKISSMAAGRRVLLFAYVLVLGGLACGGIAVTALADGHVSRSVLAAIPALAFVTGGLFLDSRRLGRAKG